MANAHTQQQPKRQIKKRDVIIAILLILLLQFLIFAYFYWKQQDLGNIIGNKIGPAQAPTPLFGIYGSGKLGSLNRPMAVTVYDRKVYVSDTDNHRVAVFDYDGKPLYAFGTHGNDKGQFSFPYGITIDNAGLIYVADLTNGNIQVFSQDGKFVKYFLDPKSQTVVKPAGMFFADNNIFVTDVALNKVMAFDLNGKKVLEFGKKGTGNGELVSPNAITVTIDRIYVSDTGNDRLEVFDRTGKFIMENIGDEPQLKRSIFSNTRGVAVDGKGTLYVVSNLTSRLFGFDKDGHKLFQPVGGVGGKDDQFQLPNGLFIDGQGRIYIADSSNQRVMVYQN